MNRSLTTFLSALIVAFAMTCQQEATKTTEPSRSKTEKVLLPTFEQQLAGIGMSPNEVLRVDVVFGGPILQITQGKRRAIIPRDTQGHHPHTAYLMIPPDNVDIVTFESVFPNGCHDGNKLNSVCTAKLDTVGLRIAGIVGPSIQGWDDRDPSFGHAQHMKRTGFLETLHDDVAEDDLPANSPVRAYFVLDAGRLTAGSFGCPTKFRGDPDSNCQKFARHVTARMVFKSGAALQVRTATSKNWTDLGIPLRPNNNQNYVQIAIMNLSDTDQYAQHHDIFGGLAKGAYVDLPDIEPCGVCLNPLNEIPGCGSDQWP